MLSGLSASGHARYVRLVVHQWVWFFHKNMRSFDLGSADKVGGEIVGPWFGYYDCYIFEVEVVFRGFVKLGWGCGEQILNTKNNQTSKIDLYIFFFNSLIFVTISSNNCNTTPEMLYIWYLIYAHCSVAFIIKKKVSE